MVFAPTLYGNVYFGILGIILAITGFVYYTSKSEKIEKNTEAGIGE